MDDFQIPLRGINRYVLLGFALGAVALFTLFFFRPLPTNVYGNFVDGSYWQAMDAVSGGHLEPYFLPNRITTGLGLILAVLAGGLLTHSREFSWMLLSVGAYVGMCLFFFALARRMLRNDFAALLSTVIVAFNYGALVWGLNFTADGMGWFFFIAALYCCFRFLETGGERWLWWATAGIALGGIFKEYAPCAYLAVAASIFLWRDYSWRRKIFLSLVSGVLCLVPFLAANIYSYAAFHYTYLDWWHYNHTNQVHYPDSYLDEYIKILGGIYNFAWFLCLPGLFLFWKHRKELKTNRTLQFILVSILASLPVFVWPPFQRIFFITVPAFALICGLYFSGIRKKHLFFIVPLLVAYILCGYFMDSYILPHVNIQSALRVVLLGH